MNDPTFWMELWKMLSPDQLDRLIKQQGYIRDRGAGKLSEPRPELRNTVTTQPGGIYAGPIK